MPIENQTAATAPPTVPNAVSPQLADLSKLSISSLKAIWRRQYQVPVPKGMSRDLLTRFIAHRIQVLGCDHVVTNSARPHRRFLL